MNFGVQDIRNIIYDNVKRAGFKGGMPLGKFAKDTAELIYEMIESKEPDMQQEMKTMARAKGISEEVIKYTDRICRVFSFSVVQLDPIAISVYEWMIEQEAKGQTVEKFAKWALDPERVKFVNKYRNNAGNFKNDWVLAFTGQQSATLRNEDGSLNV